MLLIGYARYQLYLQAAGTSKGVKRGSAPGHGKRSKFPKIVVSSDSEFENAGTVLND